MPTIALRKHELKAKIRHAIQRRLEEFPEQGPALALGFADNVMERMTLAQLKRWWAQIERAPYASTGV